MEQDPYSYNDLDTGRTPERSALLIGFIVVAFTAAAVGAGLMIAAKLALG